jgi:hypothetical protein
MVWWSWWRVKGFASWSGVGFVESRSFWMGGGGFFGVRGVGVGMGVRPPADDEEDEPVTVAFGIAAVDDRLEGLEVSFPASASEVRDAVGDVEVPYDTRGHTVSLAEVVAACDRSEFEDEQEFLNALHPVFERKRQEGAGVWERVRRLFGF